MSVLCTATGRRIFYDEVGTGPPLLAFNGLSGSRRSLLTMLPNRLVSRLRVIAMDNRDAGESDPEPGYYTIADMAGDAIALLDGLRIDRSHVLGYSMGATVAMQVALDHPERVDRLVLVSAHAYNEAAHQAGDPLLPPPEWWSDDPVERYRRLIPGGIGPRYRAVLTEADVTAYAEVERGNRVTWEGVMRQVATRSSLDMRPRLGEIAAPTLVIHGEQDVVVPVEHGKLIAAGIPEAEALFLPEVGHLPMVEEPDKVANTILTFLDA